MTSMSRILKSVRFIDVEVKKYEIGNFHEAYNAYINHELETPLLGQLIYLTSPMDPSLHSLQQNHDGRVLF